MDAMTKLLLEVAKLLAPLHPHLQPHIDAVEDRLQRWKDEPTDQQGPQPVSELPQCADPNAQASGGSSEAPPAAE